MAGRDARARVKIPTQRFLGVLGTLQDRGQIVLEDALADSSVNFICRPWTRPDDYWDVYWDVTREVKRRFDAAGIGIPFPQRDVHLYIKDGPDKGLFTRNNLKPGQEKSAAGDPQPAGMPEGGEGT